MKKINSYNFKNSMSKFATGVTVVSINDNNTFIGKTVNSFSSLSLKPPLVLFSLDKKSSSLIKFKNKSYIGINILSIKQKKLSENFANKKSQWCNTQYFLSKNNVPMIKNSVVNLSCQKIKTLVNGDHIIFICKVIETNINEKIKPLIYVNNKYR
tara:strand:- start:294 stop:758 length:465 start_codon:yes stop_codon:yes gene_type:complete